MKPNLQNFYQGIKRYEHFGWTNHWVARPKIVILGQREPEPLTSSPQVDVMVSDELHSRKIRSVLTKPCIKFTGKIIRNQTFRPIS